ncbi:MAG: hypothetical protein MUC90_08375 [Thermoplasmata archaeon]|jgi:hypothetical protein|nr:hypothetical protein [Thermoplasmata archaeon]
MFLEFMAVKPCRFDAYEAVPKKRVDLDLARCEEILAGRGYEILANPGVMLVVKKDIEMTLYPGGRLLMHPVKDKAEAGRLAMELYEDLGMV